MAALEHDLQEVRVKQLDPEELAEREQVLKAIGEIYCGLWAELMRHKHVDDQCAPKFPSRKRRIRNGEAA
jgi:predicted RNA-binding protein with EMAP domain